jgi:hypothetical protein
MPHQQAVDFFLKDDAPLPVGHTTTLAVQLGKQIVPPLVTSRSA